MIRIIAHRGNLKGPCSDENTPHLICEAISAGFDAEVDVWKIDEILYLGHDEPQYQIDESFLTDRAKFLWIHCKNLEALRALSKFQYLNIFWHQNDDFVLTRSNHVWTFPGKKLSSDSIAVMPDDLQNAVKCKPFGICTDYSLNLQKILM